MRDGRKSAHAAADLGDDHMRGRSADARNRHQTRDRRAKGRDRDCVLVNIDPSRIAQLVNDRMCYGAISRARLDAHIYIEDQERIRRAVAIWQ
jgi:hypothetical protein